MFIIKKDMKNIHPKVIKTKNNKKMMLSRCSICNNKKSTFISEGSGIFDSLIYNTRQNRMKDALWNVSNRQNYVHLRSKELVLLALIKYE